MFTTSATSTMPSTNMPPLADKSPEAKVDAFVSVVAPLHNDAAVVQGFIRETLAILEADVCLL